MDVVKNVLFIDLTDFYGGGQKFLDDIHTQFSKQFVLHFITASENVFTKLTCPNKVLFKQNSYSKSFVMIRAINRYVKENNIDYIILNGNRAIYFAPFINKKNKVAYKHSNNQSLTGIKKLVSVVSLHFAYLFVRKIIVLYTGAKEEIWFKSKVAVIPNGVNTKQLSRHTAASQHNEKVVVSMIGRVDENKSQQLVVDILKTAPALLNKIELWLVGEGKKLPEIRKTVIEENLDFVKIMGFRNDIENVLNETNILLLYSQYEVFPLTILEALSMELPVIATNVGAVKEMVIDDYNGYLLQYNDKPGLISALEKLVNNPAMRQQYSFNSRALAIKEFDISNTVSKIEKVLIALD